ncbi:MAG: twin-arginine translocation signal domain-containing protein [Bradyrhizobium sp.]
MDKVSRRKFLTYLTGALAAGVPIAMPSPALPAPSAKGEPDAFWQMFKQCQILAEELRHADAARRASVRKFNEIKPVRPERLYCPRGLGDIERDIEGWGTNSPKDQYGYTRYVLDVDTIKRCHPNGRSKARRELLALQEQFEAAWNDSDRASGAKVAIEAHKDAEKRMEAAAKTLLSSPALSIRGAAAKATVLAAFGKYGNRLGCMLLVVENGGVEAFFAEMATALGAEDLS